MQTYTERKRQTKGSGQAQENQLPVGAGTTNSALLDMLGEDQGERSTAGLEHSLLARQPGARPQDPRAEQEADRLSAAVTGTSPEAVKADLGQQLGADFSDVRIHTDAAAQNKAASLEARAFASGKDIYFGPGGFDPTIAAHELVHTVQQGAVESSVPTVSAPAGGAQLWPWSKKKPGEQKTGEEKPGLFQRISNKVKGGVKSLFDWAERRSGHQVDPAEVAPLDLNLGDFFEEDLTQPAAPEPKKKWWQRAGSWMKDKAGAALSWGKDKVANFLTSAKRKNELAVDQFNTFQEDYKNMSLKERVMWSIQNPIARLTASRRKKGTAKRRAHQDDLEQRAAAYTEGLRGRDKEAALLRRGAAGGAGAAAAAPGTQTAPETSEEEDETGEDFWDMVEEGQEMASKFSGDLDDHYEFLESGGEAGEEMSSLGQWAGVLENGLATMSNAKEARDQWQRAGERAAMGDKAGSISSRLRSVGSGAYTIGSASTTAQYLGLNSMQGLSPLSAGANAAGDFTYTAADLVDAVDAGKRMTRMKESSAALEAKRATGGLSQDDMLMLQMAQQSGDVAKADTIQHSTSAGSHLLSGVANTLSATGAGEPAAKVLQVLSKGTRMVGNNAAEDTMRKMRTRVANEEFHLEKRIERVQKRYPELSYNEAKRVVLMGIGFHSGKRSEAFAQGTIDRVDKGLAAERAGNQEMGAFFDRMSVLAVNGERNRDLAGERLGLRGEGDLESRRDELAQSRDFQNPFLKNRKR